MFNPAHLKRAGPVALAAVIAFAAVPAGALASAINLATVSPFVALGATTVTNTGPSVLTGDLGVAPGTSLTGFGFPAVVNGVTHDDDAVANQARADLTTAYNVAAGQPVPPADDLTGQDLGGMTLSAGAYRYTSSAQLTGRLTLDAQGINDAQFVFEIGSTLTTASASSVVLINGASPCNVFWQVGSSATLGTTTVFQGNVMALTSISLNDRASVIGRVLARNGQISLINNVLDAPKCSTASTTPSSPGTTPGSTPSPGTTPGSTPVTSATPSTSPGSKPGTKPRSRRATKKPPGGTARMGRVPNEGCTDGFLALVRGDLIKRVVFSMDGRRIGSLTRSPFQMFVLASPGRHIVRARVTFKDTTHPKSLRLAYRACAAAVLRPLAGPPVFTG